MRRTCSDRTAAHASLVRIPETSLMYFLSFDTTTRMSLGPALAFAGRDVTPTTLRGEEGAGEGEVLDADGRGALVDSDEPAACSASHAARVGARSSTAQASR